MNHWRIAENRRKFFCDLAATKGFDPLIASNWQKVTATDIKRAGVWQAIQIRE
jgi:hypothetical protein